MLLFCANILFAATHPPAVEDPAELDFADPMAPPADGAMAPQPSARSRVVALATGVRYAQQELQNALMRASIVGQLSSEQSAALEAAAQAGERLAKVASKLARRRCRPLPRANRELQQLKPQ